MASDKSAARGNQAEPEAQALQVADGMRAKDRASRVLPLRRGDE